MKITRRQLKRLIRETIDPVSYTEKIRSMLETNDISNITQAIALLQAGLFEDASEKEKRDLAQMFYDMTIGWWNHSPKHYRIMQRDLADYIADPDMDWVVSHSEALKLEKKIEIEDQEWFDRSKAVAELLGIHTQALIGSRRAYLDFEDFYKQFYEAGIF